MAGGWSKTMKLDNIEKYLMISLGIALNVATVAIPFALYFGV